MTTKTFNTTGMHCPSCSMLIEMSLTDLQGVSDVKVDYKAGTTVVTYDEALVSDADIIGEIEKAGYQATAA